MVKTRASFASGYARNGLESENPSLWRGLVGAWVPNLGVTGETLRNATGRASNGHLTNMSAQSSWVTTNKGLALDFDGATHYVLADDFGQKLTEQATVVSRFRQDILKTGSAKAVIYPYSATSWSAPYYSWQLGFNNGKIFCGFNVNFSFQVGILEDAVIRPTGQDFTVCGVFERGFISLYADGKLLATKNVSSSGTTIKYGSNKNVVFGLNAPYFPTEGLDGKVSETLLYDRALTDSEIKQLYRNPTAPFQKTRREVFAPAATPASTTYNPFITHAFTNNFQQRLR